MFFIPARPCYPVRGRPYNLRIGTFIIGVISLICSAISFILIIVCMPMIHQYRAHNVQEFGEFESTTNKYLYNFNSSFANESNIEEQNHNTPDYNDLLAGNVSNNGDYINGRIKFIKRLDMSIVIPFLFGDIISLASSVLLIIGALKRNKWLLLPWIAYTFVSVIVGIVVSIYKQIRESYYVSGARISASVLFILIALVLYLYMLRIVVGHFEELRIADQNRFKNPGKIYAAPNPWVPTSVNALPYPS